MTDESAISLPITKPGTRGVKINVTGTDGVEGLETSLRLPEDVDNDRLHSAIAVYVWVAACQALHEMVQGNVEERIVEAVGQYHVHPGGQVPVVEAAKARSDSRAWEQALREWLQSRDEQRAAGTLAPWPPDDS